jgi:hypothetical protein
LAGAMNQYLYLLPSRQFRGHPLPRPKAPANLYQEWVRACIDGGPTSMPFAGLPARITEAVLMGNLALTRRG